MSDCDTAIKLRCYTSDRGPSQFHCVTPHRSAVDKKTLKMKHHSEDKENVRAFHTTVKFNFCCLFVIVHEYNN